MVRSFEATPFGIVYLGARFSVCLDDHAVATGETEAAPADPASPARVAARVAGDTYAALTGQTLADPLVLDLGAVCAGLADDGIPAGLGPAAAAAFAVRFLAAARADDPLLLRAFAAGGLTAVAALVAGWLAVAHETGF